MKIGEKNQTNPPAPPHEAARVRRTGWLFTDGAANRIAQYESGFRVPKEDMVKK